MGHAAGRRFQDIEKAFAGSFRRTSVKLSTQGRQAWWPRLATMRLSASE